jgi:hypothetical protein
VKDLKKPLSMKPDAIRQRRYAEKRKLARDAERLEGSSENASPTESRKRSFGPPSGDPSSPSVPIHTTKTINVGGADRYAAPPVILSSDGSTVPIVPPPATDTPPDPSEDSSATSTGAPQPPPAPPPGQITPEEAKLFGAALRQYFEVGSAALLMKRPEFANGIIQISGSPADFQKNFQVVALLVQGAGERTALKYNLRIPYLDEALVVTAIGISTFGLFGKPSKVGEANIRAAQDLQRAAAARNANPQASPPPPSPPSATATSVDMAPSTEGATTEPINAAAAGGLDLE